MIKLENTKSQRLAFFDFLKMFAMFMVLWGHTIQHLQTGDVWGNSMHKIIYTFHLPLFMFISGYFSASSMKLDFIAFLKKKSIQLILPCVTWSIILYLIIYMMNTLINTSLSYSPFFVFFQHFWFLKSLFVCYIISYIGIRLTNSLPLYIILTLLIAHITTTHQIPIMYFSFLCGLLLRIYFNRFMTHYKLLSVMSAIIYIAILTITTGDLPLKGINLIDLIKTHQISPSIIIYLGKILIGISSSIFLVGLMYGLSKINSIKQYLENSYLTKMGRHTLDIYILQSIFLETILPIIKIDKLGGVFSNLNFDIYIVFPILSFLIMIICTEIGILIQRNKTLDFLLLGNTKHFHL